MRRRRRDDGLAAGPGHRGARARLALGLRGAPPELPRGERVRVGTIGSLEEILLGPSRVPDGTMNLFGALRRAMATTGYSDLKEFQRVEVTVTRTLPDASGWISPRRSRSATARRRRRRPRPARRGCRAR